MLWEYDRERPGGVSPGCLSTPPGNCWEYDAEILREMYRVRGFPKRGWDERQAVPVSSQGPGGASRTHHVPGARGESEMLLVMNGE
ncbi:hypothetical protein P4O66_002440 [Electrophorus voltai]|uniref:Uncharacterized protein n=1 Tax=Electrophorus voltai TaxID=2609070 RepID=A0AAD8YZM2_9TELE|nr:hypothetical protein P4O66_002440 [Electrophorus voltai]